MSSILTVFESSHQETLSPDTIMLLTNNICVIPKKRGSNELLDVRYIISFFS